METINLAYNFAALSMSLLIFFMKFTSPNPAIEIILRAVFKIVSLFTAVYAAIQIFKIIGVV